MPSHLPAARRIPQQARGERRVSTLLEAAETVFASSGYEVATMSAIAARAGASIGSLYQFFPNKQSVAHALRTRYARAFEQLWAPITAEAARLTAEGLIDRLVDSTLAFVNVHPAFVALLDAPSSTRSPAVVRRVIRERVAGLLVAQRPALSKLEAREVAMVILQIMKGLNLLYAETPPRQRARLVDEFKTALVCYVSRRLGPARRASR